MKNLQMLVSKLRMLSNETPWLEFKHDNYNPEMIGKDISALANSATLCDRPRAYMLWGVHDETHEIVGTNYNLQTLKKGNQELENWLRSLLSSNVDFEFSSVDMNGKTVGVLIIYCATDQPVMFQKVDYVRVGSYTRKLSDIPALRTKLWDKLRNSRFEERLALQDLTLEQALHLLDYASYFDITTIPLPTNAEGIAHYLTEEGIIIKQDNGLFAITNLGAILFAKRLSDFSKAARKSVRVVQYSDSSRMEMLKDESFNIGYASGFESIIKYIEALIPAKELIEAAFRKKETAYPILAIRESIANALIHQDFSVTGAGPLVEIFKNRIEITNPGTPLVDIMRIVDTPPRSRNEKLAALMRRLKICEELGSGWDRIILSCELYQLPAPKIELYDESTRVTLFSEMRFSSIPPEDKLWACYLHACVKYVQGEPISNSTLRERFGVPQTSSAAISRLLKEAIAEHYIKPLDPDTAPKHMKYIPIWA